MRRDEVRSDEIGSLKSQEDVRGATVYTPTYRVHADPSCQRHRDHGADQKPEHGRWGYRLLVAPPAVHTGHCWSPTHLAMSITLVRETRGGVAALWTLPMWLIEFLLSRIKRSASCSRDSVPWVALSAPELVLRGRRRAGGRARSRWACWPVHLLGPVV